MKVFQTVEERSIIYFFIRIFVLELTKNWTDLGVSSYSNHLQK